MTARIRWLSRDVKHAQLLARRYLTQPAAEGKENLLQMFLLPLMQSEKDLIQDLSTRDESKTFLSGLSQMSSSPGLKRDRLAK